MRARVPRLVELQRTKHLGNIQPSNSHPHHSTSTTMADPLYELLIPYFDAQDAVANDAVTAAYLARLTTLPLSALTSSEQQSLTQSSQSILRSLQSLSKRSHKPIISSTDHLSHLRETLPRIGQDAGTIQAELPKLETAAQSFSDKYSKSVENPILDRYANEY